MIYYGNTDVEVGEPFSITCIIPISEQIEWTKDGEPIKNLQPLEHPDRMANDKLTNTRHAKNDYVFTESDTTDFEEGIVTIITHTSPPPPSPLKTKNKKRTLYNIHLYT